VLSLFQGS